MNLTLARTAVVVPLASLQATLDGDLLTLAQILAADLRQAVPGATLWYPPGALVTERHMLRPRRQR